METGRINFGADQEAARDRYMQWRHVVALENVADELRGLYWLVFIVAFVFLYLYFKPEVGQ